MPCSTRVTDDERAVLELLVADPGAFSTAGEIARLLQAPPRAIYDILTELIDAGQVTETWIETRDRYGTVHRPALAPTEAGRAALAGEAAQSAERRAQSKGDPGAPLCALRSARPEGATP